MSEIDDEDELQELLKQAPKTPDIRGEVCVFCEEDATSWVPVDDCNQFLLPDEFKGVLVPVCEPCKADIYQDTDLDIDDEDESIYYAQIDDEDDDEDDDPLDIFGSMLDNL